MPSLRTTWKNPWVRRPIKLLLAFVLTLGVCWLLLDYAGKAAWRAAQQQLAAAGESVEPGAALAPLLRDEENFCNVGFLRNIAVTRDDHGTVTGKEGERNAQAVANFCALQKRLPVSAGKDGFFGMPFPDTSRAGLIKYARVGQPGVRWGDLQEALKPPRAAASPQELEQTKNVETALAKFDGSVSELQGGLALSQAQWMPPPQKRLASARRAVDAAPQLMMAAGLIEACSVRAARAGLKNDLAAAIASLQIATRVVAAMTAEPWAVEEPAWLRAENFMVCAIWVLCRQQQGTLEQWAELEQICTKLDVPAQVLRATRAEMVLAVRTLEEARTGHPRRALGSLLQSYSYSGPSVPRPLKSFLHVAPSGVFEAMKAEAVTQRIEFVLQPTKQHGARDWAESERKMSSQLYGSDGFSFNIPRLSGHSGLAAYLKFLHAAAELDSALSYARAACVLERHRIAQGSYPNALAGLTSLEGGALLSDRPGLGVFYESDGQSYRLSLGEKPDADLPGTKDPKEPYWWRMPK